MPFLTISDHFEPVLQLTFKYSTQITVTSKHHSTSFSILSLLLVLFIHSLAVCQKCWEWFLPTSSVVRDHQIVQKLVCLIRLSHSRSLLWLTAKIGKVKIMWSNKQKIISVSIAFSAFLELSDIIQVEIWLEIAS